RSLHSSTVFPYTTLFRSGVLQLARVDGFLGHALPRLYTGIVRGRVLASPSRGSGRAMAVPAGGERGEPRRSGLRLLSRLCAERLDRKSTRLNSSHRTISY